MSAVRLAILTLLRYSSCADAWFCVTTTNLFLHTVRRGSAKHSNTIRLRHQHQHHPHHFGVCHQVFLLLQQPFQMPLGQPRAILSRMHRSLPDERCQSQNKRFAPGCVSHRTGHQSFVFAMLADGRCLSTAYMKGIALKNVSYSTEALVHAAMKFAQVRAKVLCMCVYNLTAQSGVDTLHNTSKQYRMLWLAYEKIKSAQLLDLPRVM